jgi:hypothetical protein
MSPAVPAVPRKADIAPAVQKSSSNVGYGLSLAQKPTVRSREEFRMPAGVRKSPKNEPAEPGLPAMVF